MSRLLNGSALTCAILIIGTVIVSASAHAKNVEPAPGAPQQQAAPAPSVATGAPVKDPD